MIGICIYEDRETAVLAARTLMKSYKHLINPSIESLWVKHEMTKGRPLDNIIDENGKGSSSNIALDEDSGSQDIFFDEDENDTKDKMFSSCYRYLDKLEGY